MDFMRDALWDGRPLRTLNLLDDGSREEVRIAVDFSLPAIRVVRVLGELGEERGLPREIVIDNGPEFASNEFAAWAAKTDVYLRPIRPGKPVENCFVESFNGTFRKACFGVHWFEDLDHARHVIESSRRRCGKQGQ